MRGTLRSVFPRRCDRCPCDRCDDRSPPAADMIAFDHLGKKYGELTAVRDLDFVVNKGEVFGFLGPNGAGKTTTIRMMMGILVPSGGRALINGLDCHAQRAEVQRHVG